MAEAAGRGAAALSKSRIKPEIYTAVDGKMIVEDELLNFLEVSEEAPNRVVEIGASVLDTSAAEGAASGEWKSDLCGAV
ncbi:hypothetical protein SKAU_G00153110 [Synaphobranchus kaupii]|uniref:Uncharacterized protein n=1 Tax=Synaphobranchus kaupii TaxID=118154 RepID=A0A9Q1IY33_SYNKA|nr:hypothetical protein SKAU_G00153110 [Synaphobranchus kaupii]